MQPPFGRQNFLLSGDLFHIPTELPQTLIDGIEPNVALVQFLMQLVLLGQVICYQRPHLKVGQRKAAALEAPDGSVWNLDGKNGLGAQENPVGFPLGQFGQVSPKVLGVEQFAVKQYPARRFMVTLISSGIPSAVAKHTPSGRASRLSLMEFGVKVFFLLRCKW